MQPSSIPLCSINVLVVEDEQDLREAIADYLSLDGMQVISAATLEQAEHHMAHFSVDILVLDLGLGEDDGLVWIQQRRDILSQCGLIMATARGQQEDRILGVQAGADVYLTKPFVLEELSVLIRNLYQTLSADSASPCWILLYILSCLNAPNGKHVKLNFSEKRVLEMLEQYAPDVCPRDNLIEALGEDVDTFDPKRLEVMCRRLKQRVKKHTEYELPIETVHAQGYRLIAPILIERG
ncbi:response regulator transcription factor [Halomonas sp. CH40]